MPEAPCNSYITHDELVACCENVADGAVEADTLLARQIASSIMFYVTGQQYPGQCSIYVRPQYGCTPCSDGKFFNAELHSGRWVNLPCGSGCACNTQRCFIDLSQYPAVSIEEVWIDGVLADASEYYMADNRIYWTDPDTCWPTCNRPDRPAFPELVSGSPPATDFEGTYGFKLLQGHAAPQLLKQATIELACHYQDMCSGGCNACQFAIGLVNPNTTVDYAFNEILPWVFIGIPTVDTVIRALNPYGFRKVQGRIWSPEASKSTLEF
jgi:hypothetical protein